jgi:hypothetical protein
VKRPGAVFVFARLSEKPYRDVSDICTDHSPLLTETAARLCDSWYQSAEKYPLIFTLPNPGPAAISATQSPVGKVPSASPAREMFAPHGAAAVDFWSPVHTWQCGRGPFLPVRQMASVSEFLPISKKKLQSVFSRPTRGPDRALVEDLFHVA